ncbi:hypothetical protein X798_07913 [Onchocerca flexuosa]|uniref:Glucuronosyltransferase n=2 Tax=Onchocerca flexuosa TaxID=387005 RepID=A0A183I3V3_9BILA|nr:hypothetical protein X798_07913 [Onchocerca flexuosa]VDP16955.1 unnamed protein product [Onchocerca flexuosa]
MDCSIAMLVDPRQLQYSDRIHQFWPEFSQYEKTEAIHVDLKYHGIGTLFGQEVVEKLKLPITAIFSSSFNPEMHYYLFHDGVPFNKHVLHSIEFLFGLPLEVKYTVSRLVAPPFFYTLKEILYDPRILHMLSIEFETIQF